MIWSTKTCIHCLKSNPETFFLLMFRLCKLTVRVFPCSYGSNGTWPCAKHPPCIPCPFSKLPLFIILNYLKLGCMETRRTLEHIGLGRRSTARSRAPCCACSPHCAGTPSRWRRPWCACTWPRRSASRRTCSRTTSTRPGRWRAGCAASARLLGKCHTSLSSS